MFRKIVDSTKKISFNIVYYILAWVVLERIVKETRKKYG